jgi:hypothetical protein
MFLFGFYMFYIKSIESHGDLPQNHWFWVISELPESPIWAPRSRVPRRTVRDAVVVAVAFGLRKSEKSRKVTHREKPMILGIQKDYQLVRTAKTSKMSENGGVARCPELENY